MAGDISISREELYSWPSVALIQDASPDQTGAISPAEFQQSYIDILPEPWTAISLHLNESKEDLFVARYRKGQPPFILRVPLTPQSHALDDGFSYEDGRAELQCIITDSYDSTHNAEYVNTKEAKKQWWDIRESLDARLHELLLNIEKIWFGGFRGIFSSQMRQPLLLARFQKAVLASLNRHLPSRQGKKQHKPLVLDPRIWEMFTGLGDPRDESVDMDESLIDLLYFIVDILQFNGEPNAYDEVDFDSLVIETLDALKAYYAASAVSKDADKEHTILILDKDLHMFPWESLPCLAEKNVSRLPSIEDLRTRILAMESSQKPNKESAACNTGHHISRISGASLLNPSGDLPNTETVLKPLLQTLPGEWNHTIATPSDKELASTLSKNSLFLYFGHGSGNQFISSRAVRTLDTCPTTWLMGCSSAALTSHGDSFLPSGMVLSYLAAGAPAVVGTLWDVTDKDCDRASVHMGETWGLWRAEPPHKLLALKGRQKNADTEQARGTRVASGVGKGAGLTAGNMRGNGAASKNGKKISLVESVRLSREECYLRYLNGAALIVYGIPVYLDDEA
jgi:separase